MVKQKFSDFEFIQLKKVEQPNAEGKSMLASKIWAKNKKNAKQKLNTDYKPKLYNKKSSFLE